MSNLTLGASPTLADFQSYVRSLKVIRGFADDPKAALLGAFLELGEVGALVKRHHETRGDLTEEQRRELAFELADALIFLLDLANQFNIDLEQAFRGKEEINKSRQWGKFL